MGSSHSNFGLEYGLTKENWNQTNYSFSYNTIYVKANKKDMFERITYHSYIINNHQSLKKNIKEQVKKNKLYIKFDFYRDQNKKIYFLYKFLDKKQTLLLKLKNL